MILRSIVIMLPKRRQVHSNIHLISVPHRICRIGDIFFIKFIISVAKQVVRNALPFRIQAIYIEIHAFRQIGICRILPHVFSDFLVLDVIFEGTYLVGLSAGNLISQFQLLLFYVRDRFYNCSHIAHILHGLCHFLTGAFCFFFFIYDRSISHSS